MFVYSTSDGLEQSPNQNYMAPLSVIGLPRSPYSPLARLYLKLSCALYLSSFDFVYISLYKLYQRPVASPPMLTMWANSTGVKMLNSETLQTTAPKAP